MPWFKRAYRGLYGNRMIQFGNKISFAENKSRRTWKPNVQKTTLWSETLQEKFKTKLTTYVMRCIRKAGGFDQYLLRTKDSEIKYPRAIELKRRIIAAQAAQKKATADGEQNQERTTNDNKTQTDSTQPLSATPPSMMRTTCSRGLLDLL